MKYTVVFKLSGALADAVAVEWSDAPAPDNSGAGWEPCVKLGADTWRMASYGGGIGHWRDAGPFGNIALRYRLEAAGPWSPISPERKEITLVEMNEDGTPKPVLIAPLLLGAPVLGGTATIGTDVTASAGEWSGTPQPMLAFQWLRNGAPIEGATAATYRPAAADDLCALACRVVAVNVAGTLEAVSEPLTVRYAPPAVTGELFDEVFDERTGPQDVDAALAFSGENLSFAVTGKGATIDERSGLLRLSTDVPVSGETVEVSARNSGGEVKAAFLFTVEAVEVAPRQPVADDWRLFAVRLENGKWTGVIATRNTRIDPVAGVDWIGVNINNYPDAAALEPHYEPTVPFNLPGYTIPQDERWWLFQSKATIVHERDPGTSLNQIRCRYRLDGSALSSPCAANAIALNESQIVLAAGTPPAAPDTSTGSGWKLMPIRTAQEKALNLPGGEAMQFPHSAWRDPKNPNLVIWGQDMGSVWWSKSATPSWNNSGNLGLWCYMIQAVGIHPTTGDWYAVAASAYEASNRNLQGIYRKKASVIGTAAERWELVYQVHRIGHWRWFHETITFAPNGDVVVALNRRQTNEFRNGANGATVEDPGLIVRSPSGNPATWTQVGSELPVATFGQIAGLKHHPTNAAVMYLCTSRGLLRTTNSGASWQWLSGQGGLPQGLVRNICMNPNNGNQIYIPVSSTGSNAGVGVYYSGNSGTSFSQINTPAGAAISKIFASPVDFGTASARLYLMCRSQQIRVSGNNGASWQGGSVPGRPGTGPGAWTSQLVDNLNAWLGFVLPHPTIKGEAIAHGNTAFQKTTDGGATWTDASHGFSGMAASQGTCWDFHNTNANRFALGIYDGGWLQTEDGGQSFSQTGPTVTDPDNTSRNMHQSMHQIARLWNANEMVGTIGLIPGGFYTVRSTNPLSAGSYSIVNTGNGRRDYWFMRRHRLNENIIYHQNRRSTNRGVSWSNYGGNEAFVLAMHHGNPDVLFSLRGSGASTTIGWSGDQGASFQILVNVGWAVAWGDARFPSAFCPDVTDTKAFWTVNSGRDLARWSPSTGWKTDFNLLGLASSLIPGGLPQGLGRGIGNIAVDPQDRNRVYVVVYIPGAAKVFMTKNAWAANPSWEDISGDLPMTPGGLVEVNPVNRELIRATNGNGNYRMPFKA